MARKTPAYRRIGEVAEWLGVPASTIRYWGTRFKQVKPVQRAGGRRYYRFEDMVLLGGIKALLHDQGMSIEDLRKYMRNADAVAEVARYSQPLPGGLERPDTVEHEADIMRFRRPPPTEIESVEEAEEVEELRRISVGGAPGGLHFSETVARDGASDRSGEEAEAEPPNQELVDTVRDTAPEAEAPGADVEPEADARSVLLQPLPSAEGLPRDERGAIPPLSRHELRSARAAITDIVEKLEAIRARMGRR